MLFPDPPIDEIVHRIVEHAHPRRVFLFGSRALGEARPDSDVDIMVEMETALRPAQRRLQIALLFPKREWSMDVLVYTPDEVEELRRRPGSLVSRILREGLLLYPADSASRTRVREPSPEGPDVQAWIAHAEADWLTVQVCLAAARVPFTAVCFHAQQAAEKYLKALLASRQAFIPRSHDLQNLLQRCTNAGVHLDALLADCALLSQYAVEARYPEAEIPRLVTSETEAREAVASAARVMEAVKPLIRLPAQ